MKGVEFLRHLEARGIVPCVLSFRSKENLYREGEPGITLFVLLRGKVTLTVQPGRQGVGSCGVRAGRPRRCWPADLLVDLLVDLDYQRADRVAALLRSPLPPLLPTASLARRFGDTEVARSRRAVIK